jgi:hypothetical protein
MICGVCLEMTGCRVSYCRLRSVVAALVLVDGEKKAAGRYFLASLPFLFLFIIWVVVAVVDPLGPAAALLINRLMVDKGNGRGSTP